MRVLSVPAGLTEDSRRPPRGGGGGAGIRLGAGERRLALLRLHRQARRGHRAAAALPGGDAGAIRGRPRPRARRGSARPSAPTASGRRSRRPATTPRGLARIYRRECFEKIGGIPERLGSDPITVTYGRMNGYSARTFADLPVRHLRPMGSRQGILHGRARHGATHYIVGYGLAWAVLRSLMLAVRCAAAAARWRRLPRTATCGRRSGPPSRSDDESFREFARREQRRRLLGAARRRIGAARGREPLRRARRRGGPAAPACRRRSPPAPTRRAACGSSRSCGRSRHTATATAGSAPTPTRG